ncbi:MAG: hypothetical protein WBC63_01605, partial [Candidatus Bipolaricaulia bacterium]
EFEGFLQQLTPPRRLQAADLDDVRAYAQHLIEAGRNERARFVALYHYADLIGNHEMMQGVVDLLGGFEMLGRLCERVASELGADVRDRVFAGLDLPVLGTPPIEWVRVMSTAMPRLEAEADPATVKQVLDDGIRDLRDEGYADFKQRFEESESLDAFLEDRRLRHLDMLRKHRDEGTLYYDQPITDDLVDFVEQHPEIGGGIREGNTIIEIKIPHRGAEYLATDDVRMKQYHVCHCPLVKESIPRDDLPIPSSICEICPSHNRKPWEVAYGCKLQSEVVESALRGALWCKFAIDLP